MGLKWVVCIVGFVSWIVSYRMDRIAGSYCISWMDWIVSYRLDQYTLDFMHWIVNARMKRMVRMDWMGRWWDEGGTDGH